MIFLIGNTGKVKGPLIIRGKLEVTLTSICFQDIPLL